MRAALLALGVVLMLVASAGAGARRAQVGGDWARFGYTASRQNAGPAATGITAANVARLQRRQIRIDGTVDSSAVYLRGATVRGRSHDVFVVTTTYGRTIALDADSGSVLWQFTPPSYSKLAGTAQITTATPLLDRAHNAVYAAAPDGRIRRLALSTGRQVWATAITRDATHEKIASPLNLWGGRLIAATGGYIGDAPPYQGHVVTLNPATGRIIHVWNSLCSNRHALITPSTCGSSDSAIWGRNAVVVDTSTGRLLAATGNANWNGRTDWGDSVVELSPDASRLLGNYTPRNQAELNASDADLGSTAPALLGGGLALQGGKDGKVRLLRVARLNGTAHAGARLGGELQTLSSPGGAQVFTAPAVWKGGGHTWVFVATNSETWGYVLRGTRLAVAWRSSHAGTSPVVAGGLLYVYDPGGGLNVYRPTSGRLITTLPAGSGHWNSPIVTDGRIALPEGSANDHATTGILDVYRLGSTPRTLATPSFVRVATGFDAPDYVTAPLGEPGVLYVVELKGKVWKLDHGARTLFLDVGALIGSEDEEGLLSMAFDRNYATNHYLYVDYTAPDHSIHVVRYTSDGTTVLPASAKELLQIPHPGHADHFGGLVVTTSDHRLYVGTGDGGGTGDPDNNAQNLGSRLGKLLSLDLTHPSAGWRMVALGLRNPWRFSFDRQTGDLYVGDVGQGSWEEVDVVHPSDALLNMEWPIIEGNTPYEQGTLTKGTKLVAPVLVYAHQPTTCNAVVGGFVYRGSAVPAARGKYYYGDWCTGAVWSTTVANGKASTPSALPAVPGLVSFGEDASGEVYAVSLTGGSLWKLQ